MLSLKFSNYAIEVGCDEAGRGCLAGPVTAAAIILPENFNIDSLNDSKQLSKKKRDVLRPTIENLALGFAVTHILNEEIDEINILNTSMKAMQESILKLKQKPDFIIIDGNRPLLGKLGIKTLTGYNLKLEEIAFLKSIPNESIIKGDSKYMNIAAASILAKTHRDEYMNKIHEEFPMYNWSKNKGYPTKDHREAIAKYGVTKYHRKSFKLLPEQFVLDL
ncbi:ribonuclease HII [Flavobacterium columnare]|uniref:ribonuclease HII n=1 Tax=Flavobacterium columnare TaxID=996 RepID=UPI0040337DF7